MLEVAALVVPQPAVPAARDVEPWVWAALHLTGDRHGLPGPSGGSRCVHRPVSASPLSARLNIQVPLALYDAIPTGPRIELEPGLEQVQQPSPLALEAAALWLQAVTVNHKASFRL